MADVRTDATDALTPRPVSKEEAALIATQVAALTAALQFVRHYGTVPPLEGICGVCERDAARMLGALRKIGWDLVPKLPT